MAQLAAVIVDQISGVEIIQSEPRKNDAARSRASITKAGLMLHWQPSIKLADGLIDTWEWFNDNNSDLSNSE